MITLATATVGSLLSIRHSVGRMPAGEWDSSKSALHNNLRLLGQGYGVNDPELHRSEHLDEELRSYFGIVRDDSLEVVQQKVSEHLTYHIATLRPEGRAEIMKFRYAILVIYGIHGSREVTERTTLQSRREWLDSQSGDGFISDSAVRRYWRQALPLLEQSIRTKKPPSEQPIPVTTESSQLSHSGQKPEVRLDARLGPLFDRLIEGVESENRLLRGMLLNPTALPVRWTLDEGSRVQSMESGSSDAASEHDGPEELATLYKGLTRRQLIVVGEAGAGKTVMAVQVQQALLGSRSKYDPIPVIFPMSSWNPAVLSLHDWMWRRLGYQFDNLDRLMSAAAEQKLQRKFIEHHIIPILDGFDEMPKRLHSKAANALEVQLGTADPVIVTCRTEAYNSSVFLPAARVVGLEPLVLLDSRQYLTTTSTKWHAVFADHSGTVQPVSTALRTPLMVWLSSRVYRSDQSDPATLLDFADHEAIERHLLQGLVNASFGRAGATDSRRLMSGADEKDATHWLGFLAHGLLKVDRRFERRDISWWEFIKLTPWRSLGLSVSLVSGALLGLEAQISISLALGQLISFVCGIWFGFGFGRAYSTVRAKDYASHGRSGFTGLFSGTDPELLVHLVRLGFGILCALVAGSAAFVVNDVLARHNAAMHARMPHLNIDRTLLLGALGALICCIIGLGGGFVAGRLLSSDPRADKKYAGATASSPAEAVRRDGKYAARQTFLIGAALTGLVTTAVLWWGMRGNIGIALICSWTGGLAGSFVFAAWPRYRVAHAWLVLTGKLPQQLMIFLDDAHREGVVRQTAIAYEFRHDLLQRSLANSYEEQRKASRRS